MPRLLFEKTGSAVYMSHLDLMRLFQRAFKRAGLTLWHTQGFNQRPSVSIALPLSLGTGSVCELLDFDLVGENVPCEEICRRLNAALVSGVKVRSVYEDGRKLKELTHLECLLTLCYDAGVPQNAECKIRTLFSGSGLIVPKKGKNGVVEQDILTMIRRFEVDREGEKALTIRAVICAQNPTLNPMQIAAAIDKYLPELSASFVQCTRLEIFDSNLEVFR